MSDPRESLAVALAKALHDIHSWDTATEQSEAHALAQHRALAAWLDEWQAGSINSGAELARAHAGIVIGRIKDAVVALFSQWDVTDYSVDPHGNDLSTKEATAAVLGVIEDAEHA